MMALLFPQEEYSLLFLKYHTNWTQKFLMKQSFPGYLLW